MKLPRPNINKNDEYIAWKLLAEVSRKKKLKWHLALNFLAIDDKKLWNIVDLIQENNHIFYNPTNTKWLIISDEMELIITTNPDIKKDVLKGLKLKVKQLKMTLKGVK